MNPTKGPVVAYRLEPVYEAQPGAITTAAVMTCALTGKVLSGMGGGGLYLAPEAVDRLRQPRRNIMLEMVKASDEHDRREQEWREWMNGTDSSSDFRGLLAYMGEACGWTLD